MSRLMHFRCPCDNIRQLLPAGQVGQVIRCPQSGARFRVPQGIPFGEEEWRAEQDPRLLLSYLRLTRWPISERRQRLLACACLRRRSQVLQDELAFKGLETAERLADGLAGAAECRAAEAQLDSRMRGAHRRRTFEGMARLGGARALLARPFSLSAYHFGSGTGHEDDATARALLREVLGDPFRPPSLDPAWTTRHDGAARRLAEAIYAERAFDRLPVLADALEDAGCVDAVILAHCREQGPHVLGCWALDLLLGKA
jgi:hypothetical protein